MAFNFKPKEKKKDKEIIDKDIVFDPIKHQYYYKGKPFISVTQFIHRYSEPFNSLFSSISKSKKNKSMGIGITNPELLRKYWKLNSEYSSSLGTSAHIFAELYLLDRTTKPKTGYDKAVIKAINKLEETYIIEAQEDILYSTEYMIAGTRDLKLRHKKTNEIWIGDWKTTLDMDKSYNKMLYPFHKYNDSALNRYSIQLDLYSLLDKDNYIPETNRIIIQLKYNGGFQLYYPEHRYKKYRIPYTLKETKQAIKEYINEKRNDK